MSNDAVKIEDQHPLSLTLPPAAGERGPAARSKRVRFTLGVIAVLLLAAAATGLGFTQIEHRPMHADEAVHAIKFGEMLAPGLGQYEYDPTEYHGPTLYYATQGVNLVTGKDTLAALEAADLRATPVFFGVGLILLTLLVMDGLSPGGAGLAALLTMACPLIVYYSRDFIHETLFVFFTFLTIAAGYRYARAPLGGWVRPVWAAGVGGAIALMWASKETVVFVGLAMVLGVAANRLWAKRWGGTGAVSTISGGTGVSPVCDEEQAASGGEAAGTTVSNTQGQAEPPLPSPLPRGGGEGIGRAILIHAGVALGALLLVALVLFTSFFTNWQGALDSVGTYWHYVQRGAAEGQAAAIHEKPWWYYFRQLGWVSHPPAPVWTYAFVVGLALVGGVAGFAPRLAGAGDARLARFLAVFTVALLLLYSVLPYKQPWLLMGPLHGFVLLAGIGGASLARWAWSRPAISAAVALCGVGVLIGAVSLPYRSPMGWSATVLALVLAGGLAVATVLHWLPRSFAATLVAIATLAGAGHMAYQTKWSSTRFVASRRNPLAYAQTSTDVGNLVERVNQVAAHHPRGMGMPVRVIAANPWPLPWYFRRFEHVGYWPKPPGRITGPAPVLVMDTPGANAVAKQLDLGAAYQAASFGLRPGTLMTLYVDNALWEKFMADRR